MCKIGNTLCTLADCGVLTQLKKQQRHSVSSLTIKYVQTHPGGHWPFERTSEQHTNSQTIRSTHIVACDKCKLNLASNEPKLFKNISFQFSVDTGKNKVRSCYNYFYKFYLNLISAHNLEQVHFSKNMIH
jgi:hypothetical protein